MFEVARNLGAFFSGSNIEIKLGMCARSVPAVHGAADHGLQFCRGNSQAAVGKVSNLLIFLSAVRIPFASVVASLSTLNDYQLSGAGEYVTTNFR